MKVILAAPFYHQPRGNKVTVERISNGLQEAGLDTKIISSTDPANYKKQLNGDIYHGFHASHFFQFMKNRGETLQPYALTLTGTDLNHDLFHPDKREEVIQALISARAIHVFTEEAKEKLLKELPSLAEKTYTIPQGVSPMKLNTRLKAKEPGTFLFILPAGIRKVKNVPFAILALQKLRQRHPEIRLWIVGPIIEEAEGMVVRNLADQNEEWVSYIGSYPHHEMGSIYMEGDVILNTSISEGQSSAILESLSLGIPVLVSNNEGNRSIVSHRITGFLYDEEEEFLSYAEKLIADSRIRKKFSTAGKKYIAAQHSWKHEIKTLLHIYSAITKESVNR